MRCLVEARGSHLRGGVRPSGEAHLRAPFVVDQLRVNANVNYINSYRFIAKSICATAIDSFQSEPKKTKTGSFVGDSKTFGDRFNDGP